VYKVTRTDYWGLLLICFGEILCLAIRTRTRSSRSGGGARQGGTIRRETRVRNFTAPGGDESWEVSHSGDDRTTLNEKPASVTRTVGYLGGWESGREPHRTANTVMEHHLRWIIADLIDCHLAEPLSLARPTRRPPARFPNPGSRCRLSCHM
jgi:hypothetical protein